MSNSIKIAFTSWAGAGKTVSADYLRLNYDFNVSSFADGIKFVDRYLFGSGKKDRLRLQTIGQFFRTMDKNIWISRLLDTVSGEENFVCDDLRQWNEYEALNSNGFRIIRIVADEDIRIQRLIERDGSCDVSLLYNESESGCSNLTLPEIENNGTLEELYEKIDILMSSYGIKKITF
jgi:dephospho-CoA kinase